MKIGFIGLGVMGAPMALHLVNAGHSLFGPNGVAAALQAGGEPGNKTSKIVVDMSPVSAPTASTRRSRVAKSAPRRRRSPSCAAAMQRCSNRCARR